jgi:hypothetical protein
VLVAAAVAEHVWWPRGQHPMLPLLPGQLPELDLRLRLTGCTSECTVNISGNASQVATSGMLRKDLGCLMNRTFSEQEEDLPGGFLLVANSEPPPGPAAPSPCGDSRAKESPLPSGRRCDAR